MEVREERPEGNCRVSSKKIKNDHKNTISHIRITTIKNYKFDQDPIINILI